MSESSAARVAVVGSLNIDYFARVETLPTPGVTVTSRSLDRSPGGKGANQAIAARRQGAEVALFGTVGADDDGESYRKLLEQEGIAVSHVQIDSEEPTGSAFILLDQAGENMIVTISGANSALLPPRIQDGASVLRDSGAILAQLEVPVSAVVETARLANDAGIPFLLNPSPIEPDFPWHEVSTDFLIVNENEATGILEFPALEEEPSFVLQRLHELRVESMIVTRGGNETLFFTRGEEPIVIEPLPVLPVDTVGAGDAFAGCFAARIAEGEAPLEAIRKANCAGALTTLGAGAQDPIPDREKVERHLQHLGPQAGRITTGS